MRRAVLVLAGAIALAAPPLALAEPVTEVSELGDIRAEFSYDTQDNGPPKNLVQRIYDAGELIVENVIPDDAFLYPGGIVDKTSVKALDLDGEGKAEVTFDIYTGGAHCCLNTEFYNGVAHFNVDWGNFGYRRKDFDGDGRPEFRSADDFFSGAYTAYAFSQPPLKVLRYSPQGMVDFTRDATVRPTLLKEAKRFRRVYRNRRDGKGIIARELVIAALAGNAADQCSLGDCEKGYDLIRKAVKRGHVPKFKHFLRTVRKDLRERGYDEK